MPQTKYERRKLKGLYLKKKHSSGSLHPVVGHPGNEIRQYRPAFFEGFENETVAFDTLEQLIEIPWVKNFSTSQTFHQFSVSDNALMAEYRGGREWWVCGFLKNPVDGLPKWNHGLYEVWNKGKAEDIPGELVASSCGDDVTLRDGRTLKRRGR